MNKKVLGTSAAVLLTSPLLAFAALVTSGGEPDTAMKIAFPTGSLSTITETVANYVIGILVLIAVFYIIKAGYEFVTASGDSDKVNLARQSVMYAAIGIIIALLAKGIVNFVIGAIGTGG